MGAGNIEIKYRRLWRLGTVVSFAIYFSGLLWIYLFFQKRIFHDNRRIVLTYHRIRDDDVDPDITVRTNSFEKQVKYLKDNFEILTLHSLIRSSVSNQPPAGNQVAVTFDVGYKDNYSYAYPILRKYDVPVVIFLVVSHIGTKEEMLDLAEIKVMALNHIAFGSHTVNHSILTHISEEDAKKELIESKKVLENLLESEVPFFAYPVGKRGHFDQKTKAYVREAGYEAAFTTENGAITKISDPFEMGRIGIRECPLFVFKVRVSGFLENCFFFWIRRLFRMT